MFRTLGLIVNPIAGMGGRVGLKGTDGPETVGRARALGAEPGAPQRAAEAMRRLREAARGPLVVLAAPAALGEDVARDAGWTPRVVGDGRVAETTPEDTHRAARAMADAGVDLLLFVGGDGTARDVCAAVGERVAVLGIPAGVKMHSAVYATGPRAGGDAAARFLEEGRRATRSAEVMDIDEEAYRAGALSAALYGYLRVPAGPNLVAGPKARGARGEDDALAAIAAEVAELAADGDPLVLGPGTTTRAIAERLGVPKTLLGVDVVAGGRRLVADAAERDLLATVADRPARIVVTPIGGQGYLLGRGNQPISAAVIRAIGPRRLVPVATPGKLAALEGRPLLVDTGDPSLDAALAGYARVVTGYRAATIYPLAPA